MVAAAKALGLTVMQLRNRWKKLYPGGAWLGEAVDLYHNPVCGGKLESFHLKTGQDAINARPHALRRFVVGLELQMVWVWDYVQSLNTAPVIALMTTLLGDLGFVFHVSPRAPRASLCWGVPLLLLLLLLLSFIRILSVLCAFDS